MTYGSTLTQFKLSRVEPLVHRAGEASTTIYEVKLRVTSIVTKETKW